MSYRGLMTNVLAGANVQGWERMKRNCLFQAIAEEKNVELVSVLVKQPGFDVNARFYCDCKEACEVNCKATLQPLHVISTRGCADTCQPNFSKGI